MSLEKNLSLIDSAENKIKSGNIFGAQLDLLTLKTFLQIEQHSRDMDKRIDEMGKRNSQKIAELFN